MKIAVVGTGYVGLVTGTCLAEKGNDVVCIDNDKHKVERLRAGEIPIYEPDLAELVSSNIAKGTLSFSTELKDGVVGSEVIFLALPTPESEDGSADLKYVLGVSAEISKLLRDYTVVVTKSTVPPGTSEKVRQELKKHADEKLFDVASNPEFLKEGAAIQDFQHPDRVVIGVDTTKAWEVMHELYLPFFPNREDKIIHVDIPTAETIKYAANTFLAARVALTNEVANISEMVGADAREVMHAVGLDTRIGGAFLNPSPGYGGSCFPKDVQALIRTANSLGYDFLIGKAIHESNSRQKDRLAEKVRAYFKGQLAHKKITVWGLSFKPNTDDIRETPASNIIDSLTKNGAQVVAYDPKAIDNMKAKYPENKSLIYVNNRYDALAEADALIIVTDWDEFKTPDWKRMKAAMKSPVIFDGRSLYSPEFMKRQGFYYESIGRKTVRQ